MDRALASIINSKEARNVSLVAQLHEIVQQKMIELDKKGFVNRVNQPMYKKRQVDLKDTTRKSSAKIGRPKLSTEVIAERIASGLYRKIPCGQLRKVCTDKACTNLADIEGLCLKHFHTIRKQKEAINPKAKAKILLARKEPTLEERRRKYWRCPNAISHCHEILEREYKNLATTGREPCDLRCCRDCRAIEQEEWNAREEGIERLKPHLSWHCYRMLKPDTPRKRRVVLGVLKEGKKIVAWPDWRDDMTHLLVQPHQTEELAKGRYHPGVYCKAHYKSVSDSEFELIGVCPPYYSEWQKAGELDHLKI